MYVSDLAIRRPIVTITAMLALVVFGLVALASLKTDEFPDIQPPIVTLTIPYPGASPSQVEREVIDPLEDQLFAIGGIDAEKTEAIASDGLATFIVWFRFEKPIQEAEQDVRDAVSRIRNDLPQEMKEPILSRFEPGQEPIVTLAITSDTLAAPALTRLAEDVVQPDLQAIQGVAQARIAGGQVRELTVQVRPQALAAAGLAVSQVVQALEAQNLAAPVGSLESPHAERNVRLVGRVASPEEFAQVVVATRNGQTIRLGQVADVFAGTEEQRTLALHEGREAVGIDVLKTKGFSTTDVADRIAARAAALAKRLPREARLEVVKDSGVRVRRSVDDVKATLLEGALLTILVVFLFLNSWRSTVITGLALPVSVLAAFIGVWAFGFTLNTMSLLGLSLAIGILVDDAIVVRENIVRHVEAGEDHETASHRGTDEIGLAVAATTFSIVAVFIPIAFIYGLAGQWMKPFALTIAAAVLVSLFVSFSLDPMLSAYWADPQVERGVRRGWVTRTVGAFNRWFDAQTGRYTRVVGWALDHRLAVIGLATLSLVGAVAVQGLFGGFGFVPVSDRSELQFLVETPPGSSIGYTRAKVEQAVRMARSHPEVAYTYASIGTPLPGLAPGVDEAIVYVRLVPKDRRALSQDAFGARLRGELARIAGMDVSVFTSGFGGAQKQIQMQLQGPDAKRLTEIAGRMRAAVASVRGAVDVGISTRGQRPEVAVSPSRGVAGTLGITVGDVAQSLRPAFAGIEAGDWVDPVNGKTRKVRVRFAPQARATLADLRQLPLVVRTPSGGSAVVPLGQVVTLEESLAPAQITHVGRERTVVVQANVQGRPLSDVVREAQAGIAGIELPAGYRLTQGGEARDTAEVFGRIFLALGVAVLLMYLVLVVQFGSFLDPLAILLSLPLSLVGVVVALLVTGDTLNIMSLIGVILLFGIVAKNAILLVDFAKWSKERTGASIRDALVEAGRTRLRPIVMTSVAIVAGMIPVALGFGEGADFRAPLGRAVIGGVVTSTVLTLVVIPTVYELMDGWRVRIRARIARALGRHAAPGASAPRGRPARGAD